MNTAKELFWKHGFKKVSIDEICQKAEVSKMTFYRYFTNKLEIAKAVYDMVANESMRKFSELINDDSSASEKMKKLIEMKLEGVHDISKEFLIDFYSNPELGLSLYIEKRTKEMWFGILEDFRNAQKKGIFRKDFKPEILLLLSGKMIEMINDENVLKLYNKPEDLVMEITNLITYGISPKE